MIETRKDFDLCVRASECVREHMSVEDVRKVLDVSENVMFISGENVALAVFDYPGVYTVHWYYTDARGRAAIDLGIAMSNLLFEEHGAQILRALVKREMKASRWACRQLGFKSCGFLMFPDPLGPDENEFLYKTKEMYMNMKGNI